MCEGGRAEGGREGREGSGVGRQAGDAERCLRVAGVGGQSRRWLGGRCVGCV